MPSSQPVNVLDPSIWERLPKNLQMDAIVQVQDSLVTSALDAGSAEQLLALKQSGVDLSRLALLLAHRDEAIIPQEIRDAMGKRLFWMALVNLDETPPPGANDKLINRVEKARASALPEGDDAWVLICSQSISFLASLSLDRYFAKKKQDAEDAAEDAAERLRASEVAAAETAATVAAAAEATAVVAATVADAMVAAKVADATE